MSNLSGINNFGRPGFPPPGIDPNTYAQSYANSKGISLDEAKNELRAQFGDPQPPSIFGPQQPGDPQPHIAQAGGPQRPGDPQPHSIFQIAGPQQPGDPEPHLYRIDGPKNPGDPQKLGDKEGEKRLDELVAEKLGVNPRPGLARDNDVEKEADIDKLVKSTEEEEATTDSTKLAVSTNQTNNMSGLTALRNLMMSIMLFFR